MTVPDNPFAGEVSKYDADAKATGWYGPEIIFGLAYQSIRSGQSLLDIGIGTGLGSMLFMQAGLEVFGMDISTEMLEACRKKGYTRLKQHDLKEIPWPYATESMDHVISTGVLSIFKDLSPIFAEIHRIMRRNGLLGFITLEPGSMELEEVQMPVDSTPSAPTVSVYHHPLSLMEEWLSANGFQLKHTLKFTIYMDPARDQELLARAVTALRL